MAAKAVVARPRARLDVEEAIDYLLCEAGDGVALAFADALQSTYDLIAAFPDSGSNRYAHELALPGLRTRKLTGYPYLVFYLEHRDYVEVWRVLHAQRDIPRRMEAAD
jgi:toxin ParE1/3/4